jgi:hypothetical protein
MQTEVLNIIDLPDSIIDSVCDRISQSTLGLCRIVQNKNNEYLRLIGSGTLVIVNGLHCILTAQHVLAEFGNTNQLGLLTSFSGKLQRYAFDRNYLSIHEIAKGREDSRGPDIGIIVLPQANIGHLKAEKTFFNIDKRTERFDGRFLKKDLGFWFTCGVVGETERDLDPSHGFFTAKSYEAFCGVSGINEEYEDSGFDYLEVTVDYNTDGLDLPDSFGGCSGAGIWQVPIRKDDQDQLNPEEYLLSGVVFYQTAKKKNKRLIRCHGRKTIYEKVPEFVNSLKLT